MCLDFSEVVAPCNAPPPSPEIQGTTKTQREKHSICAQTFSAVDASAAENWLTGKTNSTCAKKKEGERNRNICNLRPPLWKSKKNGGWKKQKPSCFHVCHGGWKKQNRRVSTFAIVFPRGCLSRDAPCLKLPPWMNTMTGTGAVCVPYK